MSVALVTCAWGDGYAGYVDRWWHMACTLDPAPAEVIVAHHPDDPTGVERLPEQVRRVECRERSLSAMWNAAYGAATADWVQQCPLDDLLTSDALAVVDGLGDEVDVVVTGARSMRSGDVWLGDWGTIWADPTGYRMNHHAVVRREFFARVPFGPEHWSDWGWFLRADAAGARVHHAGRVTLVFDDTHGGRYSNLGGSTADAEIEALKRALR